MTQTIRLVSLCSGLAFSLPLSLAAQEPASIPDDPEVDVRIEVPRGTTYERVSFTVSPASYVVVIRVGPAGNVAVLYPSSPAVDRAFVTSAKPVVLKPLIAKNTSAEIFAFASRTPFDFSKVSDGTGWNSLHLASFKGLSGHAIAEEFVTEITSPLARVAMATAPNGAMVLVDKGYRPATRGLAAFKSMPCPTLSRQVGTVGGMAVCSGIGKAGNFISKPVISSPVLQKTIATKKN
jgi:hypothetical protein